MELIPTIGVLAVAFGAAVSCDSGPAVDARCGPACASLKACGFLPSILGASSTSPSTDSYDDCVARCGFSGEATAQQQIFDCTDMSPCERVGTCLHGVFPDSPVTGTSRVSLVGTVSSGDGGLQQACAVDAGAQVAFARGFVGIWGTRSYSDQEPCTLPLETTFQDVPAEPSVSVGFQLFQAGQCSEYAQVVDIRAGNDPQTVQIDLGAAPTSCVPDAPLDAAVPDAADASQGDEGQ